MRKKVGNILMVLSLGLLAYVYYPILMLYLPRSPQPTLTGDFIIEIPKIHAQSIIIENIDPWNKAEYYAALKKGVAQAKGSFLPGQNGTIFLFAHSSLPPWEMTRLNTAFLRLPELNSGDQIIIFKGGKEFRYTVYSKKEIWPKETEDLIDLTEDKLILQTCVPIGTDLKRLLVFARPE